MSNKLNTDLTGKYVIVEKEQFPKVPRVIDRVFLCKSGFGCRSETTGRTIFGAFVSDGEECRINGDSDIDRFATPEEITQATEKQKRMKGNVLMTVHSGIALDFLIEMVKKDPSMMNIRGKPATKADEAEILSQLYDYKAKGYEVFPMCDNVNEKGICKGHSPHKPQAEL